MQFFRKLIDLLFGGLSDTAKWNDLIAVIGPTNIYVVLFLIVFAETGFVVTPFLPGDSLLFAIGAVGSRPEIALNLPVLTGLLIVAAILGDAVNYWIGYRVGPAIFRKETAMPVCASTRSLFLPTIMPWPSSTCCSTITIAAVSTKPTAIPGPPRGTTPITSKNRSAVFRAATPLVMTR